MRKGSKLTEENKEKIRQKLLGRKLSAEHIANISKGVTGLSRPKSKETRIKLSIANKRFAEKNKRSFEDSYTIEPNTGCWLWTGAYTWNGYGRFHLIGKGVVRAHRHSYEMKCGKIPEGLVACHKCDQPACCNPDHIFIGTQQDNVDDREYKNRGRWATNQEKE
jgi:hypothetical protein